MPQSSPEKTPEANPPGFLEQLGEMVGPDELIEAACRLGAIKRQRKVDLPALVQATITAMAPTPGVETTAFVNYLSLTGQELAPSAFYNRYSDEFAALMRELMLRALKAVRDVSPQDRIMGDYGVLLKHFSDIRVTDSTCHLLKKLAACWAPSTSKKRPAGIKFHTVISLWDHLPISGDLTPQRVHDNKAFREDSMEPGTLSLFDLGYIDVERFIDATERGAFFVTRLKENHDPEIVRVHRGAGSRVQVRGMGISAALKDGTLDSDVEGVIDLDVRLTHGTKTAIVRAVAVEDEECIRHWYLTSVGRDVLSPRDIAETYRLRWEVELLFKQLKSGAGLTALLAWRASAVASFVYAKVIALCLTRLLQLSVEARVGRFATTQLALILALSRAAPLLMSFFMMQRGVTLPQLEERILLIAKIVARSRNQRRGGLNASGCSHLARAMLNRSRMAEGKKMLVQSWVLSRTSTSPSIASRGWKVNRAAPAAIQSLRGSQRPRHRLQTVPAVLQSDQPRQPSKTQCYLSASRALVLISVFPGFVQRPSAHNL